VSFYFSFSGERRNVSSARPGTGGDSNDGADRLFAQMIAAGP